MSVRFGLHPDFAKENWHALVCSLDEKVRTSRVEDHILGGRNQLVRIEFEDRILALKRFRNKGVWKKIAYRFSSSKARRSFEHSVLLRAEGIGSPQPIAWRENWDGFWMRESYYLCEFVEIEHDASALVEGVVDSRFQKVDLLGMVIGRMHKANLLHLDMNQGNWLFSRGADGAWNLDLIDNNRMKRGKVSLAIGVRSLLSLGFEGENRSRLIASYAKERGVSPDLCTALYKRSLRPYRAKWWLKNTTRPWRRKLGL